MTATPKPFRNPDRPTLRKRPLKALGHFRKLVADKEDTVQVFYISECLPSKKLESDAAAFCASAKGQALMQSEAYLPALLDDHESLMKLAPDSVGRAYVEFMKREGLTAAGLVAESEKMGSRRVRYDDQLQWFHYRLRDTHDLVHVLTGYGRDALGEQCALGFSSGQYPGLTDLFISWAGALELRSRVKSDAPVFAAVGQSRRHGKAAQRVYAQDIRALLAEPLEAARARMGIGVPTQYTQAHQRYRARGIDPYTFLAAA
jgi:ubiquinone biosynthesis protein COQ4